VPFFPGEQAFLTLKRALVQPEWCGTALEDSDGIIEPVPAQKTGFTSIID
jgi:hypothetical protein